MPEEDCEGGESGASVTTPSGVPNLPQDALTLDNLASRLQDMSSAAMKSRAAERFPSTFNTSTGSDPALDLTPFGILTSIWAGINSLIANADPADIEGPQDLPPLLLEFIEGLPVVGELVGLLEAIFGTYTGDDSVLLTVQEIFAPIRKLLQLISGTGEGFPTLEEIISGWAEVPLLVLHLISELAQSILNGFLSWIQNLLSPLGLGATPVEFTAWLNSLPSIEDLIASLTGIPFGDMTDLQVWADQLNRNSREFWNGIVDAMDIDRDGDVDLSDVGIALGIIPAPNVLGTGGPATIEQTWQEFWDRLWSAFTLDWGTGKSISDVTNAADQLSTLVNNHELTLGIRDNRPAYVGLDQTTDATFNVADLAGFYIPVTAANSWCGVVVPTRNMAWGKVSWLGYNTLNITTLVIETWWMALTPAQGGYGKWFLITTSPNLISGVSDAVAWNTWDFTDFTNTPPNPWMFRIKVTGTGTYYIAGKRLDNVPSKPDQYPRRIGGYLAGTFSGSNVAATDMTYHEYTPWFGAAAGDVGWHEPVLKEFPDPGTHTYDVPTWAKYVDLAMLPGGAGGRSGDIVGGTGEGGDPGSWLTVTLERGVHFKSTVTTMSIHVGDGGLGGQYGSPVPGSNPGDAGESTTVSYTNPSNTTSTTTAAGPNGGQGISGIMDKTGHGPGLVSFSGRTFYGGLDQNSYGGNGNSPGGSGAGGSNLFGAPLNAGSGAPGIVWCTARQG